MTIISIYNNRNIKISEVNSRIIKIVTISIIEIVEKINHFFIKKIINRKSTVFSTVNLLIYIEKMDFSTFSTDFFTHMIKKYSTYMWKLLKNVETWKKTTFY